VFVRPRLIDFLKRRTTMTMIFEHATHGITDRVLHLVDDAKTAVARWRRIRRNTVRLSDLDDRLLADIGVRRDQIGDVARRERLQGWGDERDLSPCGRESDFNTLGELARLSVRNRK